MGTRAPGSLTGARHLALTGTDIADTGLATVADDHPLVSAHVAITENPLQCVYPHAMDTMPSAVAADAGELDTQAVDWLLRGEQAGCTAEERVRRDRWLASPRNRAAYVRMYAAWSRADQLRQLRPLDGLVDPDLLRAGADPVLRSARRRAQSASRLQSPAVAYVIAAVALTALVSAITAWIVTLRVL